MSVVAGGNLAVRLWKPGGRCDWRRIRGALLTVAGLALTSLPVWANGNLIEALEDAPIVVTGTFDSVTSVGYGAYVGELRVDEHLSGSPVPRTALEVAWEEPGLSVEPRYARGHRILVGLEPLPTASIWKQRISLDERRDQVWFIDTKDPGAIQEPSAVGTHLIHHYLALSASARQGDAGLVRLTQMMARTEDELAQPALARLDERLAGGDDPLPQEARLELVVVLQRDDAPGVVRDLLRWIDEERPAELLEPLSLPLEEGQGVALRRLESARAAITGRLDSDREVMLLASDDAAERAMASRYLQGDVARRRLPVLIFSDPSPRVRAVALVRWADLQGAGAIPEAVRALDDPSVKVRRAAAEVLAGMGEPAIDDLHSLTRRDASEGARMAVASLSMMGMPAQDALQDVAIDHDDEGMRTLARIALGLPIGHHD